MDRTVQRARHPGLFLGEFMRGKKLTQKDFAKMIGKSPTEINAIIKGIKDINVDFAIRFSLVFKTTPDVRLNMQHAYDIYKLHTSPKGEEYKEVESNVNNFSIA